MTNPTTPTDNTKLLTPEGLTNQLFDGAWKQNPTNPQLAAHQVISFLMNAIMYALQSSRNDPVVFLTEALVDVIAAIYREDETSRREVLKHISAMLTAAAEQPPPAQGPQPTGAQQAFGQQPSKPVPGKP